MKQIIPKPVRILYFDTSFKTHNSTNEPPRTLPPNPTSSRTTLGTIYESRMKNQQNWKISSTTGTCQSRDAGDQGQSSRVASVAIRCPRKRDSRLGAWKTNFGETSLSKQEHRQAEEERLQGLGWAILRRGRERRRGSSPLPRLDSTPRLALRRGFHLPPGALRFRPSLHLPAA
ncbi:hypothetical protein KC19_4G156900 [Ceratodon purpureus]|uniref:Uncharacterized protein n=1 Tax=Ceratodon purpureus TaxID=3225 RepID=A0A8T0I9Y9_CERPU|nr:hypothetical protein KC19_4G156900 [Ceratodon purpureus]